MDARQRWKQRVNLSGELRAKTGAQMIRISPGEYVPLCPTADAPSAVLAVWEKTQAGTFRAVPITDRMLRLTAQLASVLGFQGSYDTLYRLGRAGFVEMIKIAPHTTLLNVDSFYRHLRKCAEDPWYWEDAERLAAYSKAIRAYDEEVA